MKNFTSILSISSTDEYGVGEDPTHALIELPRGRVIRIIHLASIVKKEKVYAIEEFDYTPEYKTVKEDAEFEDAPKITELKDWDGRVDATRIHITDDSVSWLSYVKHTNIELSTGHISIKCLKKFLKGK
jgi:hypothetical protein